MQRASDVLSSIQMNDPWRIIDHFIMVNGNQPSPRPPIDPATSGTWFHSILFYRFDIKTKICFNRISKARPATPQRFFVSNGNRQQF
jgi:hypothetical protein